VVAAPARQRVGIVFVVAAFTVSTAEVLQAQHRIRGFGGRRAVQRRAAGGRRDVPPETPDAHRQGKCRKKENGRKQAHQQVVGKQLVEIAAKPGIPEAAFHRDGQDQEQRQARSQRHRQGQAVALVKLAQRRRPGVVDIGLAAHFGHGFGHIDRKLMRRRILAGVQAGAAVVAQVGQEVDVGLAEFQPARHGRKHRAKALAVATGVADLHLPADLGLFGSEDGNHAGAASQ